MWTLTKHYYLHPLYKFIQPGNRYYLFKDLIRCNCLDVLQTIKFLTLLYTARGVFVILPTLRPESLLQPRQQLCLGRGSSQAPLQSRSSHALRAAALPACSLAVQRMLPWGRVVPLATSPAKDCPCCPESLCWHCLRGTAALPELCRVGRPRLSTGGIFALSFLFCSLFSQVSSTDLALGKHCELIRSSSEWGVHLPAPSYSQNNPKLLGQLPQSFLPSLPLLFPSKHCSRFNIKAPSNAFIPFFWSSFKLTSFFKLHRSSLLICIW